MIRQVTMACWSTSTHSAPTGSQKDPNRLDPLAKLADGVQNRSLFKAAGRCPGVREHRQRSCWRHYRRVRRIGLAQT